MGADLSFKSTMAFTYGEPQGMAPGVSRLVAENPSPFTFKGTNTYLVGSMSLAIIDPGPDDGAHVETILKAAAGRPISHIFVTHAHRDHVGAVEKLKTATGAQSVGFGRAHLDAPEVIVGPSGSKFVDSGFAPDIQAAHGDVISGEDWALEVLHTPGHAPDHLCFWLSGTSMLFSGDHVMAWNTTVIAPPEGVMADYFRSLELLMRCPASVYLPGHGGRIEDAGRFVKAYLLHRRWRERAIYDAIAGGVDTVPKIVSLIYRDLDKSLVGAATLSVEAHVEHLIERGEITVDGPFTRGSLLRAVQ